MASVMKIIFNFIEKLFNFSALQDTIEMFNYNATESLALKFITTYIIIFCSRKGGIPDLQLEKEYTKILDFSFFSESENEATIKNLTKRNKIGISNVIFKQSPHAAWGGLISLIEEDKNFIVSPKGIYFLYVLLLSKTSNNELVINNQNINSFLRRFFQYK